MFFGYVYNKHGEPIENIKVSDGRNIALTAADGSYSLPGWERANLIFVCALTRHHDDYYRYIDKEHDRYDFYVDIYEKEGNESSFLQISDTEIFIDGFKLEAWSDFIKSCRDSTGADFLIHTGDICRRRGLEEHGRGLNSDNFGIPVRYTLGNHDYVDDKYGEYTFERLYGPIWYSFDLGGTHYVCLPITKGEAKGLYHKDDSLIWLENDLCLTKGKRTVIFCHTYCEGSQKDYVVEFDGKSLDLKKEGLLAWVFGHLHNHYLREDEGVFTIGTARPDSGGIDFSVGGCRFVRIKGDKLESHIIYNRKYSENKSTSLGGNSCFAAPVFANQSLFVATSDDGYPKESAIIRVDMNGREIWRLKTKGSVKNSMILEDGALYALDSEGYLLSVDADSGKIIKETAIPSKKLSYIPGEMVSDGDELIIPGSDRIYIYGKKDFTLRKEIPAPNFVAPVSKPLVYRGRIYWAKHWSGLTVIDRENGDVINYNKDVIDSVASPIAVDDKIFFPTRYRIVCTDLSGNLLYENGGYPECAFATVSQPVYHGGKLYVGTTYGGVVEFDAKTLEELRKFECGGALIPAFSYTPIGARASAGTPLIDDGRLIFASVDGSIYFYDLDSGKLIKKVNVGAPIISGITKTDDGFATLDFDCKITFFK